MPARHNPGKSRTIAGALTLRAGKRADTAALHAIECRAFSHDRLAARSFTRFLRAASAALIVAEAGGVVSGYALTLFRKRSNAARLYSIAVDPRVRRRKLGAKLLKAAEAAAAGRRATAMRLEVKPRNREALNLYRTSGYRVIGELAAYYDDGGKALRLEKPFISFTDGR